MKKAILIFTAILVLAQVPATAMAHGHARVHHQKSSATYSLCNVEGCNATGIHLHDDVYYCGHFYGDGHDYHELCDVEGCNAIGIHLHDDVYYCGHFYGDGHDYHEICEVEGCLEMTEHEHDDKIYLPCGSGTCYNGTYYNGTCHNGTYRNVKRRCCKH